MEKTYAYLQLNDYEGNPKNYYRIGDNEIISATKGRGVRYVKSLQILNCKELKAITEKEFLYAYEEIKEQQVKI